MRRLLLPALLWGIPTVGTLALAAAITDGARYPQTVVILAFVGALSTTCAYLLTARERVSDEASLWGAAALWLSLLGAAAFDLSDLVRGAWEGELVCLVGIVVFLAIWVPYIWSRRTTLPHAAAWTLAATAALPYALAWLFAGWLGAVSPLVGAVLSVTVGFAAGAFLSRRLPASARIVVQVTAVCLLAPVWLEASAASSLGVLAVPAVGALLIVLSPCVRRVSWSAMLCERGVALIPLCAAIAAAFALAPNALPLMAWFGSAIAVGAWGILMVRRLGRDAAAQGAAACAAVTRLRTGAIGGAILATAALCGFLVTGLAWDRSSAQILVWRRAAGVPDIDEFDIAGAALRDEYLWRDHPVVRPGRRRSAGRRSTSGDFPRSTGGAAPARASGSGVETREEAVGTGLVVAFEGRTATVVLAPEGSPAHAVGIRRGDRFLPQDLPGDEAPSTRRSVQAIDFPITITVASPDGNERTVELPTRMLRQRRVVRAATIDVGGQPVGYIALRGFDPVAEREFVEAIGSFRAQGRARARGRPPVQPRRLSCTARRESPARSSASAVAGRSSRACTTTRATGTGIASIRFRIPAAGGLGAEQLVVITSGASCSASELLIKGLEPYLPVAMVGATTCGKPVGSSVFDSGDWTYSVISFAVRNARGEGEYFGGLPPTCVAADDVTRELGDTAEASLREALRYIETGRCSAEPVRAVDESGVVL